MGDINEKLSEIFEGEEIEGYTDVFLLDEDVDPREGSMRYTAYCESLGEMVAASYYPETGILKFAIFDEDEKTFQSECYVCNKDEINSTPPRELFDVFEAKFYEYMDSLDDDDQPVVINQEFKE